MKWLLALLAVSLGLVPFADSQNIVAATPDDPDATINVIVKYRAQAGHARSVEMLRGAVRYNHDLGLLRSHAITVRAADLASLASQPEVEAIYPDNPVAAAAFSGTLDYGWMTAFNMTTTDANPSYDGTGVGVAVIDSGITASSDLTRSKGGSVIVYNQSFVSGDPTTDDKFGHGTHVAGIIAGNANRSTGGSYTYRIRGIAPNVSLVNLRVLDQNGLGTDSAVIAAIQRAIQLKSTYNIRVLNLSLGRPVSISSASDLLCQAVEQAWNAGIVVVVAAGNDGRDNSQGTNGYGTINAPGNDPVVITVGAMNTVGTLTRSDDKIASYSSKGPTVLDYVVKPDLVAPGNRISSIEDVPGSLITANPQNQIPLSIYSTTPAGADKAYFQLSGTSMASPMVAGAAALLLQKDPTLTPDTVKARLMKSAQKLPPAQTTAFDPTTGITYVSENDIFTVGAGYLDIPSALASSDMAFGSAASPVVTSNPGGSIGLVTTGSNGVLSSLHKNVIWGTGGIWSSGAVWGSSVLWGTNVWGNAAVTGTNVLSSANVAWGTKTRSAGTLAEESAGIALNGEQ